MDLRERISGLMPQAREEIAELLAIRSVADPRRTHPKYADTPPTGCRRKASAAPFRARTDGPAYRALDAAMQGAVGSGRPGPGYDRLITLLTCTPWSSWGKRRVRPIPTIFGPVRSDGPVA